MGALAALLCAAVLGAPPPSTAALVVTHADPAAACLDAPALTRAVVQRLGRDPFDPLAARKANVHVASTRARGVVAALTVREPDGREGRRVLSDRSCEALTLAVALALAIAIDPLALDAPRPFVRPGWAVRAADASPSARLPRRTREPTPPPAPSPPSPDGPPRLVAGLGVELQLGRTPGLLLGPRAHVGLAFGPWRLALVTSATWSPGSTVAAVRVDSALVGGELEATRRVGPLVLGAALGVASWHVATVDGVVVPVAADRTLATARLLLGWAPRPAVRLTLSAGFAVPRPVLALEGRDVWRAWPVALGLAAIFIGP